MCKRTISDVFFTFLVVGTVVRHQVEIGQQLVTEMASRRRFLFCKKSFLCAKSSKSENADEPNRHPTCGPDKVVHEGSTSASLISGEMTISPKEVTTRQTGPIPRFKTSDRNQIEHN